MNWSIDGEGSGHSLSGERFLRISVIALAPPLIAFQGERLLSTTLGARWLLMFCAVIVSAANGGMLTGLITTMTGPRLSGGSSFHP